MTASIAVSPDSAHCRAGAKARRQEKYEP